jgi:hypothetical protein
MLPRERATGGDATAASSKDWAWLCRRAWREEWAGRVRKRESGIVVRNKRVAKRGPPPNGAVAKGAGQPWQIPPRVLGELQQPSLRPGPFRPIPSHSFWLEVSPRQNRLEDHGRHFCKIVVGVGSRMAGGVIRLPTRFPLPFFSRDRCGRSPMLRCSSPTGRTWRRRSTWGGFWVLEAADLEEALAWGRKAAVACRASVEVRPFH